MIISAQDIKRRLEASLNPKAQPVSPFPPGIFSERPQPASVLIPFILHDNDWQVLLIHRANNVHDRHSGQVSFPGGRCAAPEESPLQTALRETQEEIGISPENISILGKMIDFLTITNFRITPFVGILKNPFHIKIQKEEVTKAFTIPLEWLANEQHFSISYREIEGFPPFPVITYKPYQGEILWGASARIMLHLLTILGLLPQTYAQHPIPPEN